jgi:hypothetical protein
MQGEGLLSISEQHAASFITPGYNFVSHASITIIIGFAGYPRVTEM